MDNDFFNLIMTKPDDIQNLDAFNNIIKTRAATFNVHIMSLIQPTRASENNGYFYYQQNLASCIVELIQAGIGSQNHIDWFFSNPDLSRAQFLVLLNSLQLLDAQTFQQIKKHSNIEEVMSICKRLTVELLKANFQSVLNSSDTQREQMMLTLDANKMSQDALDFIRDRSDELSNMAAFETVVSHPKMTWQDHVMVLVQPKIKATKSAQEYSDYQKELADGLIELENIGLDKKECCSWIVDKPCKESVALLKILHQHKLIDAVWPKLKNISQVDDLNKQITQLHRVCKQLELANILTNDTVMKLLEPYSAIQYEAIGNLLEKFPQTDNIAESANYLLDNSANLRGDLTKFRSTFDSLTILLSYSSKQSKRWDDSSSNQLNNHLKFTLADFEALLPDKTKLEQALQISIRLSSHSSLNKNHHGFSSRKWDNLQPSVLASIIQFVQMYNQNPYILCEWMDEMTKAQKSVSAKNILETVLDMDPALLENSKWMKFCSQFTSLGCEEFMSSLQGVELSDHELEVYTRVFKKLSKLYTAGSQVNELRDITICLLEDFDSAVRLFNTPDDIFDVLAKYNRINDSEGTAAFHVVMTMIQFPEQYAYIIDKLYLYESFKGLNSNYCYQLLAELPLQIMPNLERVLASDQRMIDRPQPEDSTIDAPFENMPKELVHLLFDNLDLRTSAQASMVCRLFQHAHANRVITNPNANQLPALKRQIQMFFKVTEENGQIRVFLQPAYFTQLENTAIMIGETNNNRRFETIFTRNKSEPFLVELLTQLQGKFGPSQSPTNQVSGQQPKALIDQFKFHKDDDNFDESGYYFAIINTSGKLTSSELVKQVEQFLYNYQTTNGDRLADRDHYHHVFHLNQKFIDDHTFEEKDPRASGSSSTPPAAAIAEQVVLVQVHANQKNNVTKTAQNKWHFRTWQHTQKQKTAIHPTGAQTVYKSQTAGASKLSFVQKFLLQFIKMLKRDVAHKYDSVHYQKQLQIERELQIQHEREALIEAQELAARIEQQERTKAKNQVLAYAY